MLSNLSKYKVLLASKSPRRHELLSELRVPFNVVTIGGIDESYPDSLKAEDIPEYLANKKADHYISQFTGNEMVITADTLVILEDRVLGKPRDSKEATEMLHSLSGKVHKVVTGVCISTHHKRVSFSSVTEVKFADLSADDIKYYVDNYQPFDKAGSYGIQEWIGCVSVEWIKGSYYNVMGLPVHRLYNELKKF